MNTCAMNTCAIATTPLVLALSSLASAQIQVGTISPPHFATVEAPHSTTFPFPPAQQLLRLQQIHDGLSFRPRQVRGLAFRRNSVPGSFAGFAADLDVTMSAAARSSAQPSSLFADNHGRSPSLVAARRTFQFPATQSPRTLPAPFEYVIPFDVPFSMSVAACWELRLHAHGSTSAEFDAVQSVGGDSNPGSRFLAFGTGCRPSGSSRTMAVSGVFNGDWSLGTFSMRVSSANGPTNAVHVTALGLDNQQSGPLPLPFLLPGSLSAPSGACFLEIDILDTVSGSSDAVGRFATNFGLLLTPAQHGARVFSQVVALDANANALGVVTSDAGVRQIVAPFSRPPVAQIAAPGTHAATGVANAGVGLVTRFVE